MASSLRVNAIVPASGTNVAIGTAGGTITYAASVSGVSTFSSGIIVSAGSTSAPSISPSGDSNTGIFFPSADTVAIGEGGSEAIRIDSSGRVGIGTNNPGYKLDVDGEIFLRRADSSSEGGQLSFARSTDNTQSWAIDVYGNTSTPSLRFIDATAASARLTIDGSGRVLTPSQPAFFAYPSTTGSLGANTTLVLPNTQFNIGSHYNTSNGRFTAPVAGVYHFSYGIQHNATVNDNLYADLYVNGGQYSAVVRAEMFTSGTFHVVNASATIYMNASDYATIYMAGTGWGDDTWFSGHFVG